MDAYQSVVFEGDRIDAKTKRVIGVDTAWFNIGCTGSALAKMFLIGHTHASQVYGFSTTTLERQAALKMFTADFCGGGVPFTVVGTPLEWIDDHYWMKYTAQSPTLEARWTDAGASCLSKPRIDDINKLDVGTFASFEDALAYHCGPNPPTACLPTDADELDGHHIVSALP
jgi:hypothetical protein